MNAPIDSALLTILMPREVDRRAVDETMSDWREERARSTSAIGRAAVDARAVLSVARVFALVGMSELRHADLWRCFVMTIGVSTAIAAVPFVIALALQSQYLVWVTSAAVPGLVMMVLGYTAAFAPGVRRDRAFSAVSFGVLLAAAMAVLSGYLVPVAIDTFRDQAILVNGPNALPLSAGATEIMTTTELISRVPSDGAALVALLRRTIIALTPMVMVLLGAAWRVRLLQTMSWRRARIGAGLAAGATYLFAYVGTVMLLAALPVTAGAYLGVLRWMLPVAVSLVAVVLVSRRPTGASDGVQGSSSVRGS